MILKQGALHVQPIRYTHLYLFIIIQLLLHSVNTVNLSAVATDLSTIYPIVLLPPRLHSLFFDIKCEDQQSTLATLRIIISSH